MAALALLLAAGLVSALVFAGRGAALIVAGTTGTTTGTSTPGTVAVAPTTTVSTSAAVLAVTGHGWGHGYGLSQWGAYGYAINGWTYDRILAHYYSGTTLGQAPASSVRVLLATAKRISLSSPSAWSVTDAAGTHVDLAPGGLTLDVTLALPDGTALSSPLIFAGAQPLSLGGRAYRGRFAVTSDGKRLQVVDVVGLESYLKGVVPSEMPSNWPAAALQAQAVAARSYALANRQKAGSFDLYPDSRSQAYGGVAAESTAATAAIAATAGLVVLYDGKVADTMFFSTSGGRTATAVDATGNAVPYLVSVPDPYDTASPYHDWGPVLVPAAAIGRLLKLPGPLQDVRITPAVDGRARAVTLVGPYGSQASVSAGQLRVDLDLRSTWFSIALLSLAPPAAPLPLGGSASLTGSVRGASGVSLESRTAGGAWLPATEQVAPAADGTFSVVVMPSQTTWYRLAWGSARAGNARVNVVPLVTAAFGAGAVSGTIAPVASGAPVQLQVQDPATLEWRTTASGATDAAGGFSFATIAPGTYRVRCAPGHGLSPGVSASILVT